jgi:hypothetical protein
MKPEPPRGIMWDRGRCGKEEIHFYIFLLLLGERTQESYEYEGNACAKKNKKKETIPLDRLRFIGV